MRDPSMSLNKVMWTLRSKFQDVLSELFPGFLRIEAKYGRIIYRTNEEETELVFFQALDMCFRV